MHIQDSDFADVDLLLDPMKAQDADEEPKPRNAYQIRRTIERRAEIKQLRDLLGDPDFDDFE